MVIFSRRPLFLLVCKLVLVGVLLGGLAPAPGRADVGPQPVLPPGSNIQPGEKTSIRMVAEVVVMNVRSATTAGGAVAEVDADFTLKNPTSEAVSLTVWFPLASVLETADWDFIDFEPGVTVPRIESFQVSVDGNRLNYTVSELPNPQGADEPPLPWASFPVTFPGEQKTVIQVSYVLPLQPTIKGHEVVVCYIFQTGAGWAGSIGQAELIVNLPYPASKETMSGIRYTYSPPWITQFEPAGLPAGAVLEGNQARWSWENLEPGPEDDFAILVLKPGVWQGMETARAAVQSSPQDGQAWLDLALTYHFLSIDWLTRRHLLFSRYYLPLGLEAYQKAVELLPEHPTPYIGLGLLTLASYEDIKKVPRDVLESIQDGLQIAQELEARYPYLAEGAMFSSWDLEEALGYNPATATSRAVTQAAYYATRTAEATINYPTYVAATATSSAATQTAYYATRTAEATINYPTYVAATVTSSAATQAAYYATRTATATSGAATRVAYLATRAAASPTAPLTPTPVLSATVTPQQPRPTLTLTPVASTTPPPEGRGQSLALIVAAGALGLVVVGYLALIRLRKRAG